MIGTNPRTFVSSLDYMDTNSPAFPVALAHLKKLATWNIVDPWAIDLERLHQLLAQEAVLIKSDLGQFTSIYEYVYETSAGKTYKVLGEYKNSEEKIIEITWKETK